MLGINRHFMKFLQRTRASVSTIWALLIAVPCIVGICTIVPLNSSFAQAGGITFGAFLEAGLNKLQELIAKAQEAGRVLEIEAALQAESVITQAKVAYKDSLETTVGALDKEQSKVYTEVDTLLKEVEDQSNQVLTHAQTIANTLPFAKTFPQISGIDRPFALPSQAVYSIDFPGNFPFAFSKDHLPSLTLPDKPPYTAVRYNNGAIGFDIPTSALGASSPQSMVKVQAVIAVPWDGNAWWEFWKGPSIASFAFQLAKLPNTPGKISVVHNETKQVTETKPFTSETWYFDSSSDDIEEDRVYTVPEQDQKDGWSVDHNGLAFDLVDEQGDKEHDWWDKGLQELGDTKVVWRARTEHHGMGTSGKIHWRVKGSLMRTVSKPTPSAPEDTHLGWDTNKIFNYSSGEWKVIFDRFDGSTTEYNSTDLTSPFLKLKASGSNFEILTYPKE